MNLRKIAATASMTGALGFAAVGFGTGVAQADDFDLVDWPHVPGVPDVEIPEIPGIPRGGPGPGVLPPPGEIGQIVGVAPGQWNKGPVPPQLLVPLLPFCPDLNPGCINQL